MISLLSKGLSRVFSSTTVRKHHFLGTQTSLWSNSHTWYMTTGKTITLTIGTFVGKLMSLLFKMLSRFVIAFFPRSKHLLISWVQSPSTVILEPIMTFRKLLLNTFIMLTILYCLVYIKTFPLNFKTKKSLI